MILAALFSPFGIREFEIFFESIRQLLCEFSDTAAWDY